MTSIIIHPSAMSLATQRGHSEPPCLHEVQVAASLEEAEALSARFRPSLRAVTAEKPLGADDGGFAFRGALGAGFVGACRAVILQAGVRWPLHEAFALAHKAIGTKVMKWVAAPMRFLYGVEKNTGNHFVKVVALGLVLPVFDVHQLLARMAFRIFEFHYALIGVHYRRLSLDEALRYLAYGFSDTGLGMEAGKGSDQLGGGMEGCKGGLDFVEHGRDAELSEQICKAEGAAK